jgi:hypothetical protein
MLLVQSTNYEALHYILFCILLLLLHKHKYYPHFCSHYLCLPVQGGEKFHAHNTSIIIVSHVLFSLIHRTEADRTAWAEFNILLIS